MSSPFINAKVVGSNISPEAYSKSTEPRGSKDFPMSRSALLSFSQCPARWKKGFTGPASKALANGSLVDLLLLTPDKFDDHYIELPSTYPDKKTGEEKKWNGNSSWCKEFVEAHKDREPVKSEPLEEARGAVSVVLSDPMLAEMIQGAQKQVMVVAEFKDAATGLVVPVKGLIDILPSIQSVWSKMILDFKTARSANMRTWTREVFQFGYACQAAFFLDLYCAATGEDRCTFGHIISENIAPFHVEKRILSVEFVEVGRGQYLSALALYCRCLATNTWPGYYAPVENENWQLCQPEGWMTLAQDARQFYDEAKPDTCETRDDDLIP